MVGKREHGGQWWLPVPNQVDGSPPPAGMPDYLVNVGGGDLYLWGNYHPENESFTPWIAPGSTKAKTTELERGQGGWWGAQNANGRMLMIGWALGDYNGPAGPGISFLTRLTLLREVNFDLKTMDLVSNPAPELTSLRSGSLASERAVALAPNSLHLVGGTAGGAAASADVVVNFTYAFDKRGQATFGACVLAAGPGTPPFVPHWSVQPDTNAAYAKVTPGNNKAATILGDFPSADGCWAACNATAGCREFAWHIFGANPPAPYANATNFCYQINKPDTENPYIRPQAGSGTVSGVFLTGDTAGLGRSSSAERGNPLLPRICWRTLMDCEVGEGGDAIHQGPLDVAACDLLSMLASRCGSLRPSIYADVRYIDDVIAIEGLGIKFTANKDPTIGLELWLGACTVNSTTGRSSVISSSPQGQDEHAPVDTIPLFDDEREISVRILPDRSVADFFVNGGRYSGTVSWVSPAPRAAAASQVTVFSNTAGVTADIDVYGMGCGWENPSYTAHPTM